jgi:hypothetical protein
MNPNYYQDIEEPVLCDECGHPCHADDAITDGTIALCGSLRGNGCADRAIDEWRAEASNECTHDWEFMAPPFIETMFCVHCGETQR